MSLAGLGMVAIWHDLLPEIRAEFHEWHNREHMPERVGIPGFLRGRRYAVIGGGPEYFNLYEANSIETLAGQDYLQRLNAPTPWTQRVVPSFRHVSRALCRVVFTQGVGSGGVMLTLRFAVPDDAADALTHALCTRVLPPLPYQNGVSGVHLGIADRAASSVETAEKRVRADTTLVPSWVVLIEGIGVPAVDAACAELVPALQAAGAVQIEQSRYRLEYTRLKTPWSAG